MESGLPLWEFIWFIYVTFKLIRFFGLMASGKVWELIIPVGMNFGSQKELVSHSLYNQNAFHLIIIFRNWAHRNKITILFYVNAYKTHHKTVWFLKFLQFCLWKMN